MERRKCLHPGCDTMLSSYNDQPYCWAHLQEHKDDEPPKGWARCARCGIFVVKHYPTSAVDPETGKVGLCWDCRFSMYGEGLGE